MLAAADIDVCGLAKTSSQAQLCVRESNGLRVGFLGYSLRPRQYFTQPPLYAEGSPAGMIDDVERAKADCDVLVVSAHWGDEFIDRPSPEEVRLARGLIDAGANLVIGHHPHVLRGMERYHGGVIVYSLGNFVCDMLWDPILRETAVFRCKLGKTGVVDPQLVPAWINEWSQPTIADSTRANLIETRLRKLSRELEHGDLESESSYLEAAAAAHAKIRKKSHFYFVRNIYRYPPSLLGQNIANFLRNRVSEIKAAAAR
jgi:poly-gamma-glutamate synthesis protein (capsule biosynthesis protein)